MLKPSKSLLYVNYRLLMPYCKHNPLSNKKEENNHHAKSKQGLLTASGCQQEAKRRRKEGVQE